MRRLSEAEFRQIMAPREGRRRRGREHYTMLSADAADQILSQCADVRRTDRVVVSQVRFPRMSFRAREIARVDFSEVDMEDLRFDPPRLRKTVTFQDCSFRDSLPWHRFVRGAAFINCTFERCSFVTARLRQCLLHDCEFFGCELRESSIRDSDLRHLSVSQVEWRDCHLDDCRLERVIIDGTMAAGGMGGCDCQNVDVSAASLIDISFIQCTGRIEFPSSPSCFVIPKNAVVEARQLLESELSPRSLAAFDLTIPPVGFTSVAPDDLKDAPERDLILKTLYERRVSHS